MEVFMNNNVLMVQKQIKAFNKAFSRAEKANIIRSDYEALIYDLIDPERMTAGGYGKAGTKYLSSLSEEELLAYSSDIERAQDFIKIERIQLKYDIDAVDIQSLLWKLHDEMLNQGYQLDSDQVREAHEGLVNPYKMAIEMDKFISTKDYGYADFNDWWDKQKGLE